MTSAIGAPSGEGAALRGLALLIVLTLLARLLLASTLGLGVDESYTVATSRVWALSTYDHPPMAWWLAHAAATVFGTEAPLAVRLPFILLCALSTWLIFDAGRTMFSPRAGLMAGMTLNLAPVLGWTSGSMVLPDGPLLAALLAGLCCLARALFGDPALAPRWWMLAGAATGLACLSKLHGVFLLAGTGLFILTTPTFRHWLWSPWPYLATVLAVAIFSPVLIWNAQHAWVSFAFQAGRAQAVRLNLAGPLIALGGQALFLLPWVWVALIISLGRAAWSGPARPRDWLLFCLAIGPIAAFTLVALGGTHTLFHWAAPGYLFGCVLLGRDLARDLAAGDRLAANWLRGTVVSLALLFVAVLAIAIEPWPTLRDSTGKTIPYPLIETQPWDAARTALISRGLLSSPNTFVAALKWHEAGRLDIALHGEVPVRCLCADARGYGVIYDNRQMAGRDVIIVTTAQQAGDVLRALPQPFSFQSLTPAGPITINHAGQPVQLLHVYLGRVLRIPGEPHAAER